MANAGSTSGKPKRDTLAFAAAGSARPRTAGSLAAMSIEDELILTRVLAARLFALLAVRHPSLLDEIVSDWDCEARATVDREFEAALLLWQRHRINVVPCRKILYDQDRKPPQFILTRASGETEIIDSAKLLLMAGLAG